MRSWRLCAALVIAEIQNPSNKVDHRCTDVSGNAANRKTALRPAVQRSLQARVGGGWQAMNDNAPRLGAGLRRTRCRLPAGSCQRFNRRSQLAVQRAPIRKPSAACPPPLSATIPERLRRQVPGEPNSPAPRLGGLGRHLRGRRDQLRIVGGFDRIAPTEFARPSRSRRSVSVWTVAGGLRRSAAWSSITRPIASASEVTYTAR